MINLHKVLGKTGPHDAQSQGLSRTKVTSLTFHQSEPESFLGNIGGNLDYGDDDDAEDRAEVRVDTPLIVGAMDDDIANLFSHSSLHLRAKGMCRTCLQSILYL